MNCNDCVFFNPSSRPGFARQPATCSMGVGIIDGGGLGAIPDVPYNPDMRNNIGMIVWDDRKIVARVCPNFQPAGRPENSSEGNQSSSSSSSGCFLTSACVDALGKEDDCYELTVLRRFRDEWLVRQEGGKEDVARYYSFAPIIVSEIDAAPNRLETYRAIYADLVKPCVELIEAGQMNEAWTAYRQYTEQMIAKYITSAA